jgi:hypothetical protein
MYMHVHVATLLIIIIGTYQPSFRIAHEVSDLFPFLNLPLRLPVISFLVLGLKSPAHPKEGWFMVTLGSTVAY